MSAGLLGLIELLFVFGLLLWFGVSQLRALRRDDRQDAPPPDEAGRAGDAGSETDRRGPD